MPKMSQFSILASILLIITVNADYVSYLLGPLGTSGAAGSALTQLNSYTTELDNTAIALGYIINTTDTTKALNCNLGSQTAEAPLVTAYANQTMYTVCNTNINGKPVKALMMIEPPMTSMEMVGWTSAFQGQLIMNIATDFGHRFYFLTRSEATLSVNTTLWSIHPSHDLRIFTNTSTDGWILSNLAVYYNQLYVIGYMPPNPTRRILTFGSVLPNTPMQPVPLPGFPSFPITSQLITFTFTAPDSMWVVISSSTSIGSSTLQNFVYDSRQSLWSLRGQFNFNVSYPIPYTIGSSSKQSPVIIHGTTFSQLIEYGIPSGGNGAVLNTRVLSTAPYGVTYRNIAIIQYLPTLTPTPSVSAATSIGPSISSYPSRIGVTQTLSGSPSMSAKSSDIFINTQLSTKTISASVSASVSASTTSINPNTGNTVASSTKLKEDLIIGVGITIPLLTIGGIITTYILLRSGKLSMLLRRIQTFQLRSKHAPRKSPRLPTRSSTLSKIPDIQMSINPAVLKQIAIDRATSIKMAEQQTILNEKNILKKPSADNRITFQPIKINTSSAISPHMKETIGFIPKETDV